MPCIPSLQSPINPSDINTVEGKYPLQPELPGTPGNDGLGRVEAVGPKVSIRVWDKGCASQQQLLRSQRQWAGDDYHTRAGHATHY